MGRPLFSQSTRTHAPSVRVVDHSSGVATGGYPYARWSAENAFDPDSEEFSRDAVYEAFLNPQEVAAVAARAAASALANGRRDGHDEDMAMEDDEAGMGGLRLTAAGVVGGGRGARSVGLEVRRRIMTDGTMSDPELSSDGSDSSDSGRATPLAFVNDGVRFASPNTHRSNTAVQTAAPATATPRALSRTASTGTTERTSTPPILTVDPHAPPAAPPPLLDVQTPVSPEAAGRTYVAGDMVAQFGALFDMMIAPSANANATPVLGGISRSRDMILPSSVVDPISPQNPVDIAARSINRQALFHAVARMSEQFRATAPAPAIPGAPVLIASTAVQSDRDVPMRGEHDDEDDAGFAGVMGWPRPIPIPTRPSTPPSHQENSLPSPGVTPRTIYTWPHAPSAASPSPLPNPSVRMSLAHVAPPASPMHVTL